VRGKLHVYAHYIGMCVSSNQPSRIMTHDMLTHRSPEEAARAWDAAAVLHFRHTVDVKMLNFPDEYKPNDLTRYVCVVMRHRRCGT
jgi:hypothetical protein